MEELMDTLFIIFVNGKKITVKDIAPEITLASFLRRRLGLKGTKIGCGEGGCGACTVMISDYVGSKIRHRSVNACLVPIASIHLKAVTTIEGIGSTRNGLHSVQRRIADSHGSQCGFCTPGIVMSMYTLLRNESRPTFEEMENYFSGNLCRCTGYRPIIEGFKIYTEDWAKFVAPTKINGCSGPDNNGKCCQLSEEQSDGIIESLDFIPPDSSQEPIFPPELKNLEEDRPPLCIFKSKYMTWYTPTSLDTFLKLKLSHPKAKIVVGNTELGVEMKFQNKIYPIMIQASHVKELNEIQILDSGINIGAGLPLTYVNEFFKKQIEIDSLQYKTRPLVAMRKMFKWFAGQQIRNVASLGGNIFTGSPISDLIPTLMAAGSTLSIANSKEGERCLEFNTSFYTGYRKNILMENDCIISVHIPWFKPDEYIYSFKQSRRKEDDIAIVNGSFYFLCQNKQIKDCRIIFGGMSYAPISPKSTVLYLKSDRRLSFEILEHTSKLLIKDLPLPPDVPGGMPQYRQSLTIGFLLKALVSIPGSEIAEQCTDQAYETVAIKSSQIFQQNKCSYNSIHKPIKHRSADKQATGEATYIDDMPNYSNELYVGWVLSKKAKAKILSIDASKALALDNVIDFLSYSDIPDHNRFQLTDRVDEKIFAENEVEAVGQIIGIVLVEGSQEEARRAASLVQVEYTKPIENPIITIFDAIAANSFFEGSDNEILKGDPESVMKDPEISVLTGSMATGAQEHFYLETHSAMIVPGDGDEYEVYSSTQNPSGVQAVVAPVLGVPAHKVNCHVKRIGGGFGGKQRSMPFTLPLAVAAKKTKRPVRMMLDRDEDMLMTGFRHPFYAEYKIGYNKAGKIQAVIVNLYNNGGWTMDLSAAVMSKALYHCDNAYFFPNVKITGKVCKTNVASNTAFRGFGAPQGMMMVESWMEKLSIVTRIPPNDLRQINMVQEDQVTYYGMKLQDVTINRCWNEVLKMADFDATMKSVKDFNSKNKWKKQGLSAIPTKYGIAYGVEFLHQATAMVHIYSSDGSVLITHGGTEMGQGLHTKSIQVASQVLGVPIEMIHISDTSTDKIPNSSVTGASIGTDLYGEAVLKACTELKKRLSGYSGTWTKKIKDAYMDRINLSATGFYAVPDISFDTKTLTGRRFNYFVYGAAVSKVEIDVLTGQHEVLKTNIVMDLGKSLNPAIDIGQIEGAFMHGYGMFTMEQLLHSPDGALLTRGPGAYKIPGFGDIPKEFNVKLLDSSSNPRAVYSSKAVGEPPLFLASSVFFAIKNAIRAARTNPEVDFDMEAPATVERIRMNCQDFITEKLLIDLPPPNSYKPWSIQI